MSLTIVNYPAGYRSVNNEVLFIVEQPTKTADPVTYPNYKFILEVYGSGNIYLGKLKAFPHPVSKLGIFDVSSILQSRSGHALVLIDEKEDYTTEIQFYVKVGEEYGNTEYLGLITDSTRSVYKTYAKRPFVESNILANGKASNMPSTINCVAKNKNVLYQLVPFFSNVTGVTDLTITFKNDAGSTLSTSVMTNSDFSAKHIRQFNISNTNKNVSYALLTGPFSMRINYNCTKHPVRYLAWLNPFGAYDSFTFAMSSMKSIDVERRSYSRMPYEIANGGDITYTDGNVFYGQRRVFATKTKTKMKLMSNFLTDEEYVWLADLFSSPDVCMFDEITGYWMPVSIADTSYEYRTNLNSKLSSLQFNVEFSDDYNAQLL